MQLVGMAMQPRLLRVIVTTTGWDAIAGTSTNYTLLVFKLQGKNGSAWTQSSLNTCKALQFDKNDPSHMRKANSLPAAQL